MLRLSPQLRRSPGFTLMEMVVAVSILSMLIVGIGVIFRSTGQAVSMAQGSTEAMANVRALQAQLQRDIQSLDRNGYLVIRSTRGQRYVAGTYPAGARVLLTSTTPYPLYISNTDNNTDTPGSSTTWNQVTDAPAQYRYDQLTFLANGNFPNRTGVISATASTTAINNGALTDTSSANAAAVWYGHGLIMSDSASLDQSYRTLANAVPGSISAAVETATGAAATAVDQTPYLTRTGDIPLLFPSLCRHATLLMAASGTSGNVNGIPTHADLTRASALYGSTLNGESVKPHISSSRIAAAELTPAQVMQSIMTAVGTRTATTRIEADNYCYRFRVLPNLWANADTNAMEGYFRMHPVMTQGCLSFAVEWTDGTTDSQGMLIWYGLGNRKSAANTGTEPDPSYATTNDEYTAIFSFDNRTQWPKALRITYRVTDTNDRLQGGREFVQVLRLP